MSREKITAETDEGESFFTGWDFTEWELLEWSIVPVPANQEALRSAAVRMGLKFPSLKSHFDTFVNLLSPDPITEELEDDGILVRDLPESVKRELLEGDWIKGMSYIKEEDPGLENETVIQTTATADPTIDKLTPETEAALAEFVERLRETIQEVREVFSGH